MVEGETPLAPVSFKCPATHSDNDDTNHPTPSKCVKQDATKTQTAPSPGLSMRQQPKAFVTTFFPESIVLDESNDSHSVQATRREARDRHEMKERKVAEKALKVAEKEVEKAKKEVEKVKREAEKVVKNAAKEKNIAGKVSEKRNGKAKQNLTSKTPVSESLSPSTPVDPIIKMKKNSSDFCTHDAILDAYNVQQAAATGSSSGEVISVIEDTVVSDEGKGKGKSGITPAKPSDISNCMVVDSDRKKVQASSRSHSSTAPPIV